MDSLPDDEEDARDVLLRPRQGLDTLDDSEEDGEEAFEGSVDQEEYAELVCIVSSSLAMYSIVFS